MTYWKVTEVRKLREMWPAHTVAEIFAEIGRSESAIRHMGLRLKLGPPFYRKKNMAPQFEPPASEWIRVATQCAILAGACPKRVISGERTGALSRVRWRAFRHLLDSNPNWSAAGLGRVSGFDHTSILRGMRRLETLEAAA